MADETVELSPNESLRIDRFLANQLEYSRSRLQRLIQSGGVTVNSTVVTKKSRRVSAGDRVQLDTSSLEDTSKPPEPEEGPLEVHHEDPHVLAVEKPSGMVVHPNDHKRSGTLVNRILAHYPDQSQFDRAGLIHRLDKGTSGVLLVGRTEEAITNLRNQFRRRSVNKTYRAVLGGVLDDSNIKVDVPVARDPNNPMLRTASPEGKQAVTEIEVTARDTERTAVYCHPITGRTHQIRVHCRYLNTPVLGDEKYDGPSAERLILHAETIEFNHPEDDDPVRITSDIPEEVSNKWNDVLHS